MTHPAELVQHSAFDGGTYRASPLALIDPTAAIFEGCVIWHSAVIMAGVVLGKNVSVGTGAEIGRESVIEEGTRISRGVFLPNRSRVGKRVFLAPDVTCTDDRYPKILEPGEDYHAEPPTIEDEAAVGAGSVVLPGVRIGHGALIGAGSVVAEDVPPGAKVYGAKAIVR